MSSVRLVWSELVPDLKEYIPFFSMGEKELLTPFLSLQPRLAATLSHFCHSSCPFKLLLLKGQDDRRNFSLVAEVVEQMQIPQQQREIAGSHYEIQGDQVHWRPAEQMSDNFASQRACVFDDWADQNQLLGWLRHHQGQYHLQPGLVHQANGGVLILSLSLLLNQPWLWLRLKQILLSGQFRWYSSDENRPLPLSIPPMQLDLRLILVGDSLSLADFASLEPNTPILALYTEIEAELHVKSRQEIAQWVGYIHWITARMHLPPLVEEAWPYLLYAAVRYSGDQRSLPLCPFWLEQLLAEAALESKGKEIQAQHIQRLLCTRHWRESYLSELALYDIYHGQVRIETTGAAIGQLNGLSVVDYPGHTIAFGEPVRISCVVHLGDGDVTDVERKAELGGNIHAKGMLIMQAYLASELALEQPLPFSASVVFEQSYGQIDGDSASLAGLCTLVSALAHKPLSQQIAVTGAVDQFGRVQAVGGINEKIEGFFAICAKKGLTGEQGVILPASNVKQLCLMDEVVQAVREGRFHLWIVEHVADALPLLTGMVYKDEHKESLLGLINERIAHLNLAQEKRNKHPFLGRLLNWFCSY